MRALSIGSWLFTGAWLVTLTIVLQSARVSGTTLLLVLVVAFATTVAGLGAAVVAVVVPRDNPIPIRVLAILHGLGALALGALGLIMAVLIVVVYFITSISTALCGSGCRADVPYQAYVLIGIGVVVFASQVAATALTARAAFRQRAFSNR